MQKVDDMRALKVKEKFDHLIEAWPTAKSVLNRLSSEGSLLLFGGAVRDFITQQGCVVPRDFDIVVDTPKQRLDEYLFDVEFKMNRFGGYKICCDGQVFDIWTLSNTWAFRNGKLEAVTNAKNLPKTVFLNVDSIVYDLNNNEIFEQGFDHAFDSGILDIVLEENPYPDLNVLRSFVFKKRFGFSFSERLEKYMVAWSKNSDYSPVDRLWEVQRVHYGEERLSYKELVSELLELTTNKSTR